MVRRDREGRLWTEKGKQESGIRGVVVVYI